MWKIIVPTDFSDCAGDAAVVARVIAAKAGGALVFLHGMTSPPNWANLPEGWEENYPGLKEHTRAVHQQLDELVREAEAAGIPAEKKLVHLDSVRGLPDYLRETRHDLIVMGSHGRSGLRRFVMGSNAERVMRVSSTPVLIVRSVPEKLEFDTVLFASGMEEDTHPAFDKLIRFAEAIGAQNLCFVDVTTPYNFRPSGEVEKQMREYIERHEFRTLSIHNYVHYTIEAGISEYARKIGADLIGIANHGRNDISSLFVESIPENLVRYGEWPVLSIRV